MFANFHLYRQKERQKEKPARVLRVFLSFILIGKGD